MIKQLKDIVNNKIYNIDHIKFREIVGEIISQNKLAELKDYLEVYLRNAPNDFYQSHLANVVLSVYEKYLDKSQALQIALNILQQSKKPSSYAFAALLRISRKGNDYTIVDKMLKDYPSLKRVGTFEVLYELTFYYSYKNDIQAIDAIIGQLIKGFKNNQPILTTTTSLCVKYGLYEKYQHLLDLPQNFPKNTKEENTILINEIEEEEYQKVFRSAALADLTNGIAHEFGQPVTNIRYGIQYNTRLFEKMPGNNIEKKQVLDFFKDILIQTERIGKLIDRLSPITSTKSTVIKFNLIDAIKQIFQQENIRIKSYNIDYEFRFLSGEIAMVKLDNTQFNQIISNLLINSLDSIIEKKINNISFEGKIWITVKSIGNKYSLWFADNGKGINPSDYDRIFNPFYTTKPPDKGQGLGLYIVSNLLKMNGGNISVDRKYKNGAKFIILIPQNNEL